MSAHLLLETNKTIDYTKFVPTIMKKLHDKEVLSKEFLNDWFSGKLDDILAHHFLFKREHNEKLKEMAKSFIDFLNTEEEESSDDDKNSSEDESNSKDDESSSKSDNEEDD